MTNTGNLWTAYQLSRTVRSRPSELYGVLEKYGPYMAFCFDSAVSTFGIALESELDGVEGKNSRDINRKRDRIFRKWLGLPMKFRSPGGPTAAQAKGSTAGQQFSVRGGR